MLSTILTIGVIIGVNIDVLLFGADPLAPPVCHSLAGLQSVFTLKFEAVQESPVAQLKLI